MNTCICIFHDEEIFKAGAPRTFFTKTAYLYIYAKCINANLYSYIVLRERPLHFHIKAF